MNAHRDPSDPSEPSLNASGTTNRGPGCPQLEPAPASLRSANPVRWITIFGPGAIIASLTIGTGELIFSSRGGALFGYRVLFLFALILLFKWTLVFSTARHMVLSGVHPLRRWLDLPIGPRGWLPAVLFVFAALCIPIWVSFHASVLGDLIAGLTGTKTWFGGAMIHLWGVAILLIVGSVALAGGYAALEKAQLLVVTIMLLSVGVALILLRPDWLEMLIGTIWPRPLIYPQWLLNDPRPELQTIAARPIWIEASLYVGVIGGAGYDYLAYTSFLRDKRWGLAREDSGDGSRRNLSDQDRPMLKRWIRAPLIDCTISFIVVMLFSAVFVASGHLVLGPRHQIPGDGNFLEHQSQFVTQLHPWLYPLYVAGTLLAMLGTLYGTLEVAPAFLRESFRLLRHSNGSKAQAKRLRSAALFWTGGGALVVLVLSFVIHFSSGQSKPPGLTTLLIPANLFTGVLACGIICVLNPWMDRSLPKPLRPGLFLVAVNLLAGITFLLVGIKGYWDFGGFAALGILAGTIAVGFLIASVLQLAEVTTSQ